MNNLKKIKVLTLVLVLLLAGVFQAGIVLAKKNTKPKKSNVTIKDFKFSPKTVKKKKVLKVTWRNKGKVTHTVTADDGSFDSGNIAKGDKFAKTFEVKGTYEYHCELHPSMVGKVVVK